MCYIKGIALILVCYGGRSIVKNWVLIGSVVEWRLVCSDGFHINGRTLIGWCYLWRTLMCVL